MHAEERFHLTQKRAYEIYRQRDPHDGTAEEDWRKAESEIQREEEFASLQLQQQKERAHRSELMSHAVPDVENPT